jgi:pyridoxamine 5'-phosphate oxidase
MRLDYETAGLDIADVDPDPFVQFERWLGEAVAAQVHEPNAMVLSTVDSDGQPWSRYVLLKGVGSHGFEFFTNYESNKSRQLDGQAKASLTFGWLDLHRQVNVSGSVRRLPADESDTYWAVRTRGSQLGGWASAQSSELASRDELTARYDEMEQRFPGEVPRPAHWGGFVVEPHTIEFWQGRQNRLHDRVRFLLDSDGWRAVRLSP